MTTTTTTASTPMHLLYLFWNECNFFFLFPSLLHDFLIIIFLFWHNMRYFTTMNVNSINIMCNGMIVNFFCIALSLLFINIHKNVRKSWTSCNLNISCESSFKWGGQMKFYCQWICYLILYSCDERSRREEEKGKERFSLIWLMMHYAPTSSSR